MKKRLLPSIMVIVAVGLVLAALLSSSTKAASQDLPPVDPEEAIEIISPYFAITRDTLANGEEIIGARINGPSEPPQGYEEERLASIQPILGRGVIADFPSYDWVFGCSAVSGAMIAAYYDINGYDNIYTGPTNSGVMPLSDSAWSTWSDGYVSYPNNPLIASHDGVDGRGTKGSIDNYWVQYNSSATDPYITNGWPEHTWETAIGDFMKTSQSPYYNVDGSTWFFYYDNGTKLTCSAMESAYYSGFGMYVYEFDGTYGRKEFYETRGYNVGDCYNQQTSNINAGGFSLADFQAEIDAGYPVILNLYTEGVGGHSIVGYGYNGSTIYIRDTWDNNPANTYTMPWGGSYSGMAMNTVSVVHPVSGTPTEDFYNFLPMIQNGESIEIPLDNGDFEQGQVAWTEYSQNGWDLIGSWGVAHGGSWSAWLGGDNNEVAEVSQTITISPSAPYLHYWYYIYSEDICGYDYFRLYVDSSTPVIQDLCDSSSTGDWVERVVDLSGFVGSSRELKFQITTDGSLNSNFFLDDVSFSSSSSASAGVFLPDGVDMEKVMGTRMK